MTRSKYVQARGSCGILPFAVRASVERRVGGSRDAAGEDSDDADVPAELFGERPLQ